MYTLNGVTTAPRTTRVPLIFNKSKYGMTSWVAEMVLKIKSKVLNPAFIESGFVEIT